MSGGARGQGAAEVRALAAEGARVILGDVLDGPGSELAMELGPGVRFHHLDVTDAGNWRSLVDAAENEFGPIGVLVNNAGILKRASVQETSREDFEKVLAVNVTGALLGIQAVLSSMLRGGGGAIVNISSVGGMQGNPNAAAYVTSKWALRGLSKAAASDLARHNIRVNAVLPGAIETPMIVEGEAEAEAWVHENRARLLVRRMGQAGDVAAAVLFLASAESAYMTGAEIVVDGGWSVR